MAEQRRTQLLAAVAADLLGRRLPHPLRVAVDGRTAAGKTSFADELASALKSYGREVIRASIDDFHQPAAIRHRQGRYSPDGYYEDARDLRAFSEKLLQPCGPGGDRCITTRYFDLARDCLFRDEPREAPEDAILIIDGTFLQRQELSHLWDVVLFVRASADEAKRRGIGRDLDLYDSIDLVTRLYDLRYEPAFLRYERECRPEQHADTIIDNEDLRSPIVIAQ